MLSQSKETAFLRAHTQTHALPFSCITSAKPGALHIGFEGGPITLKNPDVAAVVVGGLVLLAVSLCVCLCEKCGEITENLCTGAVRVKGSFETQRQACTLLL